MKLFRFLLPLILVLVTEEVRTEELKLLVDLRGRWKFEIGDNMNRAMVSFDDSKWVQISVPSPWEDEGFPGYDGYAWYRKHFRIPKYADDKVLYLVLGNIDDVDEVYVNGRMIGFSGTFPPRYATSYSSWRQYRVLNEYLNPDGDNVIAVRVYDQELSGGIIRGDVGIYEMRDALRPDYPIMSNWKFRVGDTLAWKDPDADDRLWKSVTVPAFWETQGYKDYDGFGWYRTRFTLPHDLENQRVVLLLGKIDDFDETYINGHAIGNTGSMPVRQGPMRFTDDYLQLRAYVIAPELLRKNGENVLAVRVYDVFLHGGMYDGPIGLIRWERYQQWRDRQPRRKLDGFQKIIDWLFR